MRHWLTHLFFSEEPQPSRADESTSALELSTVRIPSLTALRIWWPLLAVMILAAWPWWGLLGMPPMAADAPEILTRTDPGVEGWLQYALSSPHFGVAWRPLMMLSFTLDQALGGLSIGVLRGTDLLLHLVAAAGVFALGLRFRRGEKIAWLALGLYLFHPALDEVVPFLPRRGYILCAAFCFPAMAIALHSRPSFRRGLGAGVLFALGLASHEIASFFVLGTLLLSWAMDGEFPKGQRVLRGIKRLLPASILLGALLVQRGVVLGGDGGYGTEGRALAPLEFASLLGEGLFSLSGPWGLVALGLLIVLLCLRGLLGEDEGRPMAWALILWIVVPVGILAAQGVWFPRIAYSMLPALVFSLAWLALESPSMRIVRLGAIFLIIPSLLASPVFRGPDSGRQEIRSARQTLIRELEEAADRVLALGEEPAVLRLVLPFHRGDGQVAGRGQAAGRVLPRDARQPWRWVNNQLDHERIILEPWLYVEEPTSAWDAVIEIDQSAPILELTLPVDREILRMGVSTARRRPPEAGPVERWRPSKKHSGRHQFLFVYGAEGAQLIPL